MALYWINATYFCAGIVTDGSGRIIEAAPILRWTQGKMIYPVLYYLKQKGKLIKYITIDNDLT